MVWFLFKLGHRVTTAQDDKETLPVVTDRYDVGEETKRVMVSKWRPTTVSPSGSTRALLAGMKAVLGWAQCVPTADIRPAWIYRASWLHRPLSAPQWRYRGVGDNRRAPPS